MLCRCMWFSCCFLGFAIVLNWILRFCKYGETLDFLDIPSLFLLVPVAFVDFPSISRVKRRNSRPSAVELHWLVEPHVLAVPRPQESPPNHSKWMLGAPVDRWNYSRICFRRAPFWHSITCKSKWSPVDSKRSRKIKIESPFELRNTARVPRDYPASSRGDKFQENGRL